MSVAHRLNTASAITVSLAIIAYAVAEVAFLLPVAAVALTAVAAIMARQDRNVRPPTLPRSAINLAVLVAIAYSFANAFIAGQREAIVSDLAEFLVIIQVIKLYDRRTARDDAQALSLSLFIVIGAILTSNSLALGLVLAAYLPVATWTTLLLQIDAGWRRTAEMRADAGVETPPPAVDSRLIRIPLRRLAAICIAATFTLGIALFFLVPRGIGSDAFGTFGKAGGGASIGFSDQIRLGRSGLLSESARPVLTMRITDFAGAPIGSTDDTVYLRGTTQDTYDPNTMSWSRSAENYQSDPTDLAPDHSEVLLRRPQVDPPQVLKQEITIRRASMSGGYFFMSWCPIELTVLGQDYRTRRPRPVYDDYVRRYGNVDPGPLRYEVSYSSRAAVPAVSDPLTSDTFSEGAMRDLAVDLLTQAQLPLEHDAREPSQNRTVANLFQRHLRDTCSYTLQMQAPPADADPIEWFVNERQMGHCEYFASAMVALCQSVGIPARVVSGYVATEFDSGTGEYLVRESNAHAWVEAQLRPGSWTRFDPTPPAELNRIHRAEPGFFGLIRRAWDRLEIRWSDTVISFDERKRSRFLARFLTGSSVAKKVGDVIESGQERSNRSSFSRRLMTWLVSTVVLLVAVFSLLFIARAILGKLLQTRDADDDQELDAELRAMLKDTAFMQHAYRALKRAGIPRPSWCPPREFADVVGETDPGIGRQVRELADLYYAVRFGRVPISAADQERGWSIANAIHEWAEQQRASSR